MLRNLSGLLALSMSFWCSSMNAADLPRGTHLEVRLLTPSGSRLSHAGDRIRGRIVAPVFHANQVVIPQGAELTGVVDQVHPLGFGLKRQRASITYRFNSLRLPSGETFPVDAQVVEVETGKERVDGGVIGGIHPNANLSSGISFVISALMLEPAIATPVLGIKFLLARSPDPEIYFPAGTEFVLQTRQDVAIPVSQDHDPQIQRLDTRELSSVEALLRESSQQQTRKGKDQPSDLVNVLLLGSRSQVARAFQAAGWVGAQGHTALALYRMYHALVQRMGYSMAPMTTLTLNGLAPDATYQKSLNTFSKRHHIRLWRQGASDIWLAAASEDVSYAVTKMHVTHATDAYIDNERAKVVNDLAMTGCIQSAAMLMRDPAKAIYGDADDPIITDGRIAVLRLNDCPAKPALPQWESRLAKQPPRRIVTMLRAISTDVGRSNPIALAYGTTKMLIQHSTPAGNRPVPIPASGVVADALTAGRLRHEWKRHSVVENIGEGDRPRRSAAPLVSSTAEGVPKS